jgi:hypothetical protein
VVGGAKTLEKKAGSAQRGAARGDECRDDFTTLWASGAGACAGTARRGPGVVASPPPSATSVDGPWPEHRNDDASCRSCARHLFAIFAISTRSALSLTSQIGDLPIFAEAGYIRTLLTEDGSGPSSRNDPDTPCEWRRRGKGWRPRRCRQFAQAVRDTLGSNGHLPTLERHP